MVSPDLRDIGSGIPPPDVYLRPSALRPVNVLYVQE